MGMPGSAEPVDCYLKMAFLIGLPIQGCSCEAVDFKFPLSLTGAESREFIVIGLPNSSNRGLQHREVQRSLT